MTRAGGEVDAYCTKCLMTFAHTVHAVVDGRPVKVECNTCHGVHRYRDPPGQAPTRSSSGRAAKPAREKAPVIAFEELLGARKKPARPYSPKVTFAVDDVIDHPTFGRGFVNAVRDGGKVEITFRSDVKILVHART